MHVRVVLQNSQHIAMCAVYEATHILPIAQEKYITFLRVCNRHNPKRFSIRVEHIPLWLLSPWLNKRESYPRFPPLFRFHNSNPGLGKVLPHLATVESTPRRAVFDTTR